MSLLVKANEANAARRRVYFDLRDATDGITPETGEASGQPQVSSNGGAWTNTGIGTLVAIGNGRYYAELTQTLVANAGVVIETRYKSAETVETPGDSVQVVAFDPHDATRLGLTALPDAAADAAGGLPISDQGGLDLDTILDVAVSTRLAPTTAGRTLDVSAGGEAGIDWSNVGSPGSTVGLSGTTVGTVTANSDMRGTDGAFLADSAPANFSDLAITAAGKVTVGTNDDKTGYSLTQAFPANFGDLAIEAATGKVTVGTNDDKSGYTLTQSFPANFADLAISPITGRVTVGTNGDKTGYSLAADQSGVTIGTVSTLSGHTPQTGDAFARLGEPAGASVSADVADVKSETASILARIGAFAGTGVNTILGLLRALARKDVAAPSDIGGDYDPSSHSLEAIRNRGDEAWTTGAGGGGDFPSVADIVAGVWDATDSDHDSPGTMGNRLNAAGGAADPLLNEVPGDYAAGTAGAALGKVILKDAVLRWRQVSANQANKSADVIVEDVP